MLCVRSGQDLQNEPFLEIRASAPTIKIVTGTGAIKRGFAQLKFKGGPSCYRALGSPWGPSVPLAGPSVPLTGAPFNCLLVGHRPGFNCIDLRGAI